MTEERRQPWFKFFPTDWQGDTALRACSLTARGLWAELICIMHKAEPYGHLLINGVAPTNAELMRIVAPHSKRAFTKALAELRTRGVVAVTDNGVLYARDMVRQHHIATERAKAGSVGGHQRQRLLKQNPKQVPKQTTQQGITDFAVPHIPEARKKNPSSTDGAKPPPDPRVKAYVTWFTETYPTYRHGAIYHPVWAKDSALVKDLLASFPPERLQLLAKLLWKTEDDWISETDRGIGILHNRISWLDNRLAEHATRQHTA
jgi:hypothetical protein